MVTPAPPKAPIAPARPITPDALAPKTAGIIVYVDPLPTPDSANSAMNPA